MGKHVKHEFDSTTGKATVIIWDKGKRYRGTAKVHEDDRDVMTQFTGLTIAEARAEIKRSLGKAKDCEKEMQRLQNQILILANKQIEHIKNAEDLGEGLNKYINDKAEFAKKLRRFKRKQEVEAAAKLEGDK